MAEWNNNRSEMRLTWTRSSAADLSTPSRSPISIHSIHNQKMADNRSMQPNHATSYSDLSEATTDVTFFMEMPGDVRATLNNYVPLDANDDTVKLLQETFKYLPSDGRFHLAEDIIQAGTHYKLRQLAQSVVTGLLTPMKVAGAKTAEITPSPRLGIEDSIEHLASMTDESMTRGPPQQLREDTLRRDGNKCVVSGHHDVQSEELYPDEVTADLETAHIVPFALAKFENEDEKQQIIAFWTNIFRYFPSIRSRLNFYYQNINPMENVLMLSQPLHKQFGRFSLALERTDTIHQYRVKTFRRFAKGLRVFLPESGIVTMTAHDGRFPLPSPSLLQVHCAVANILHATGRGEKIERVLCDYDATGGLASDGNTNVSQLLSVTKLALLPTIREREESIYRAKRGFIHGLCGCAKCFLFACSDGGVCRYQPPSGVEALNHHRR